MVSTIGGGRRVSSDPQRIVAEAMAILDGRSKTGRVPELWDGRAAERIVDMLAEKDDV